MRFAEVLGNKDLVAGLRNMADSGKIPHALLFTEQKGYGALKLALAHISYMFCANKSNGDSCGECPSCIKISKLAHPDLHFVFPTNTSQFLSKDKKGDIDE